MNETCGSMVRLGFIDCGRIVARLDRKRLGAEFWGGGVLIRGVIDKESRRKPLAFAADAVRHGI